jgi:hypothetical protein
VVRLRTVNVSDRPFPTLEFMRTVRPVRVPVLGITTDTSSATALVHVAAIVPGAMFIPQNCPLTGASASVWNVMTLSCGAPVPLALSVVMARQLGACVDAEFTTRRFTESPAAKSTASTVSVQVVAPPERMHANAVFDPFFRSVIVCVPVVIPVVQVTYRWFTRAAVGSEKLALSSPETA